MLGIHVSVLGKEVQREEEITFFTYYRELSILLCDHNHECILCPNIVMISMVTSCTVGSGRAEEANLNMTRTFT
jgi:hypothetical protein